MLGASIQFNSIKATSVKKFIQLIKFLIKFCSMGEFFMISLGSSDWDRIIFGEKTTARFSFPILVLVMISGESMVFKKAHT